MKKFLLLTSLSLGAVVLLLSDISLTLVDALPFKSFGLYPFLVLLPLLLLFFWFKGKNIKSIGKVRYWKMTDPLLSTICKVAAEVTNAAVDGITQAEQKTIVTCVHRAAGNKDLSDADIIAACTQHTDMPWLPNDAAKVKPEHRFVLLQIAIDIAAQARTFDERRRQAIEHIGLTLGFTAASITALLHANSWQASAPRGDRTTSTTRQPARQRLPEIVVQALKVLDLDQEEDWEQIKKQYKRMAMKHHPDRAANDKKAAMTSRFKEVCEAYQILKERYG